MADREIKIPFGPDRTGEFDLSNLVPEVEPSPAADADPFAKPAEATAEAGAASEVLPGSTDRFARVTGNDTGAAGDAEAAGSESASDEPAEGDGQQPGESAVASALGDVQSSLVALKNSIDQGRELKAREKQRDEFGEKLAIDLEELADRDDILAHYFERIDEQDHIIDENTRQRDAHKAELAQIAAQQEQVNAELQNMRDYHDGQLQPVETALGRAKAAAEQAKNDERSRKAELTAAETELRRAEGSEDAGMAQAKFDVVQQAHDEAAARSESAKEELAQVQQRYDDLKDQIEQAEAPLERTLDDLAARTDELKQGVAELGEVISAARKRRQYCDTVYQYPDETAKLRASIEADQETARRMDEENDELRDRLAQSKESSKMAKIGIGVVIALIVILIIVFAFVLH